MSDRSANADVMSSVWQYHATKTGSISRARALTDLTLDLAAYRRLEARRPNLVAILRLAMQAENATNRREALRIATQGSTFVAILLSAITRPYSVLAVWDSAGENCPSDPAAEMASLSPADRVMLAKYRRLQRLSPTNRTVVGLYRAGLEKPQIAELTGLSPDIVAGRLNEVGFEMAWEGHQRRR